MKKTILLLLLCYCLLSMMILTGNRSGIEKFNYTLADGESISIKTIFTPTKTKQFLNVSDITISSSAIIRSFENDSNNITDFITYANLVAENRNLGYWSVIPYTIYAENWDDLYTLGRIQAGFSDNTAGFLENDHQIFRDRISDYRYGFLNKSGIDWKKTEGFTNFYHRLFRSKAARTLLVDQAIDILVSLCNKYPSDFKSSVLNELGRLLAFTNTVNSLNITSTDGLNDYWKGFIYRRYKSDKIPVSEIQNAIIKAQTKIKALDSSQQPDAMYELNFNNQISIYFSSQSTIIYSYINKKEIKLSIGTSVESIKYLKDNAGEYYSLTGTEDTKPISYLYDKNLNKIE